MPAVPKPDQPKRAMQFGISDAGIRVDATKAEVLTHLIPWEDVYRWRSELSEKYARSAENPEA